MKMSPLKHALKASILALGLVSCFSHAQKAPSVEYLPITGVIAAEKNGVVKIASANGRFEFKGVVIDRWSDRQIVTLADAKRAMDYIELDGLNVMEKDVLQPYKFGTGKKQVLAFIDPYCPACNKLMEQIQKDSSEYTFNMVPVGLLGKASQDTVISLSCAKDQEAAKAQLVTKTFLPLEMDENCELNLTTRRMLSAKILNVQQLPFIVRHDGKVSRGLPANGINAWLEK